MKHRQKKPKKKEWVGIFETIMELLEECNEALEGHMPESDDEVKPKWDNNRFQLTVVGSSPQILYVGIELFEGKVYLLARTKDGGAIRTPPPIELETACEELYHLCQQPAEGKQKLKAAK